MTLETGKDPSRIDTAWVTGGDGGMELVRTLLTGTLDDASNVLIVLPTRRMCQEAKLNVALSGGGLTGGILTIGGIARNILDRCGLELPVMDLTTRDLIVLEIMESRKWKHLAAGNEVRSGMARAVSRTIGELIKDGISLEQLKSRSRGHRSRELADVFSDYLKKLREMSMLDSDMIADEALKMLRGSDLEWSGIGIYMPGNPPRTHRALLDELILRSDRVMIREHASRSLPWLMNDEDGRPQVEPSVPPESAPLSSRLVSDRTYPAIIGRDPMDCIRKVAGEIKRRSSVEGIDQSRFAIVLPDRKRYDDLLRPAGEEFDLDLDIGKDLPLERVPLVASVMSLVRSALDGLPRSAIVNSLSSPFLSLVDPSGHGVSGEDIEMVTREARVSSGRGGPEDS
ncbi:MAG: hypothetical protein U9R75_01680, partial [Candidatus Thermoplasmatota archaeon]|nr:hypothetical protein [Candidatus Thermoplasmatota archaeon]